MKYYIKMNNMYLISLYVDEEYVINEFIKSIEFSLSKSYALTYDKDISYMIMQKLINIGFDSHTLYIEGCDNNE